MDPNTRIVKFRHYATYAEARKDVAARHKKIPPRPLLDQFVTRTKAYCLWADELLAHPRENGVFTRGRDIQDFWSGLVIPASELPSHIFGIRGIGLYVMPEDVLEEDGKLVVHPKSIIVLNRMIQTSGEYVPGRLHETARIPLAVSRDEFECLPENERGYLLRGAEQSVRPLTSGYDVQEGNAGKEVVTSYHPEERLEFAGMRI